MSSPRSAIDRWIFEEYRVSDRSLSIARLLFALYLLLVASPGYLWVGEVPDSFYAPPLGLAVFFDKPQPQFVMWSIMAMATLLTVALLVGWSTRHTGIALAVLTMVGNSFSYAFGKIDHGILLVTTLLVLSFSGMNRHYSAEAARRSFDRESPRWPLALHALIISLAMLSAALPKITSGWLDLSTQSAKGHVIFNFYASERHTWLGQFMLDHNPDWAWEVMDWATIGVECAFLPAIFSLRAMRVICAVAVFFHVGIHFSMDIFFAPNLFAYAFFVEWDRLLRVPVASSLLGWWQRLVGSLQGWTLPIITLGFVLIYTAVGSPIASLLFLVGNGVWIRDSTIALVAFALAFSYLAGLVFVWLRRSKRQPIRPPSEQGPVILFDGVCGLCNRFVDYILRRDSRRLFRFAPLQSPVGQQLLERHGLQGDYIESIVLIENGHASRYSSAALTILRRLGGPWSLVCVLMALPTHLRDMGYDAIANRRYHWFGKSTECRLPSSEERTRFLA